jgi:hypothetical protein
MKLNMTKNTVIVLTLSIIGLSGCASPAMNENMIPQGEQLAKVAPGSKFNHSIKNIEVVGGSETIPIWASQVSSENFQIALNNSLKEAGVLSENGKYDLKATLVTLDQPIMGIGMTVRTTVDYLIRNKTTGSTIFDETIESSFTAGMSDSVLGVKRLRLANEGAIRRNIELLIKKLARSN